MQKIRVPVTQVENFKSFCKAFSRKLEPETGIRLRGNVLLNAMARAAGHDGYSALLVDSGTYGNGPFRWELLPHQLAAPLAAQLELQPMQVQFMLGCALVDAHADAIHNPLASVTPALLPLPDSESEVLGDMSGDESSPWMDSPVVDMHTLIRETPEPVIDLSGIRTKPQDIAAALLFSIGRMAGMLSSAQRKKARFIAHPEELRRFFDAHPDLIPKFNSNQSVLRILTDDVRNNHPADSATPATVDAGSADLVFVDGMGDVDLHNLLKFPTAAQPSVRVKTSTSDPLLHDPVIAKTIFENANTSLVTELPNRNADAPFPVFYSDSGLSTEDEQSLAESFNQSRSGSLAMTMADADVGALLKSELRDAITDQPKNGSLPGNLVRFEDEFQMPRSSHVFKVLDLAKGKGKGK